MRENGPNAISALAPNYVSSECGKARVLFPGRSTPPIKMDTENRCLRVQHDAMQGAGRLHRGDDNPLLIGWLAPAHLHLRHKAPRLPKDPCGHDSPLLGRAAKRWSLRYEQVSGDPGTVFESVTRWLDRMQGDKDIAGVVPDRSRTRSINRLNRHRSLGHSDPG